MNINLKEKIKKIMVSSGRENNCTDKSNKWSAKKIAIFQLLFIFAILFMLPSNASAAWPWEISLPSLSDVGKGILDALLSGLFLIIYNIGNLALNVASIVVFFGAWLVDVMMDQALYDSVLTSTAIQVGWTTIRDFCNMFFIFFLLIVAFSTILRIPEYSAKAIIPKFLIGIFLINFSMEITKLVIDFGQVFMYEIRGWMGDFSGSTGGGGGLTSIVDYFNNYFNASLTAITVDSAIAVLFAAAYSFMLGFTYVMMAGFLLVRLLMFCVLIILSPFAYFCNIFPGTRQYSKQWWGSIVKYSLFGPIFIFFVFISATMAYELTASFNPGAIAPGGYAAIDSIKDLLQKLIPNIIALMMLWMAIPITQKLGIAGSSRLIGGTLGLGAVAMGSYGAAKLAGGWGKKAAGGVASRTRLGAGYNTLRDKAERGVISKIPVVGKGIVMRNMASREKDKEEKMKKMEVEFGDLKNVDLTLLKGKAEGFMGKTGTTDDKALFFKAVAAQGKLNDPEYKSYLTKHFAEAERSLSKKDLDVVTNKSLTLSTQTTDSKARIEAARGDTTFSNKEVTKDMTKEDLENYGKQRGEKERMSFMEEQIKREKMRDIVKDGKAHEVQDLDDATTAKVWKEGQNSDQLKSSTARMTEEQREKLQIGYMKNTIGGHLDPKDRNYATDLAAEKAKIVAAKNSGNQAEIDAANDKMKEDLKFRIEAVNAGKGLKESFESCFNSAQAIESVFNKIDQKRFAKLSDDELDKYGHSATASQATYLNREGKKDKLDIVRTSKFGKADDMKTDSKTKNGAWNQLQTRKSEKDGYEKDRKKADNDRKKAERDLDKEKDLAKKAIIEKNIHTLETKISTLDSNIEAADNDIKVFEQKDEVLAINKLEKQVDNIDSMIRGDKY